MNSDMAIQTMEAIHIAEAALDRCRKYFLGIVLSSRWDPGRLAILHGWSPIRFPVSADDWSQGIDDDIKLWSPMREPVLEATSSN
mmetsp:Transcript_8940/g.19872  ORF Transcript_8940/g.19872 Transcript_8940/m.19872 type:complete len:85 (+) Transcript_8940:1726-1980(+)